ncbi:hypothetical protein ABPG72_015090 [Tetrahymena utriculariae]
MWFRIMKRSMATNYKNKGQINTLNISTNSNNNNHNKSSYKILKNNFKRATMNKTQVAKNLIKKKINNNQRNKATHHLFYWQLYLNQENCKQQMISYNRYSHLMDLSTRFQYFRRALTPPKHLLKWTMWNQLKTLQKPLIKPRFLFFLIFLIKNTNSRFITPKQLTQISVITKLKVRIIAYHQTKLLLQPLKIQFPQITNSNQIDSKIQQQKLQAKTIDISHHGVQSSQSQIKNKIQGNQEQEKQQLNLQNLPSSSSIPSPKNLQSQQQNNFNIMKIPNQQSRYQQASHNNQSFKNISNSIGQTIGAITYIEKTQSNPQNQEELIQQQQYQATATVAPPNTANPLISNLIMQPHSNIQFSANSQLYNQTVQPCSQSLQSLTSTSTPTSQGNITQGSSTIQNKISSSQTNIGSIRNENATYFSPATFQIQGGSGFTQQFQEENGNKEELDCFKSPFDQKYEISNTGNSNAITTSKTIHIGKADSNNRQGSCPMLPTKLESFESFNQIQEQGNTSIQNLPEFNFQLVGQQNMNNPSTLSQSLTDISPRKGSLAFLNSDMVAHQQNQQDNYYSQMNSQFSQVLQQKDYKIPSQSFIGPQSMIDITQNSKSTCSTSSPSPFHTVTSPTYPNSCKTHLYQQITRLDSLQLNQVDLSSNNISPQLINTTNPSSGFINNHLNKQYSHQSQSQQQQQLIQQQPQQFPSSTPLIQESSLDQSFSSDVALSNNNFQDDPNNSSTLKSKNSLSNQYKEQSEHFPFQAISRLCQQEQTEESPVIFVKNIKINEVTPENVYNIFRNFGYVHSILFLREKKTVLIQYEEVSQAKMAINQLNNMSFQGDEQMRISYAKHKTIIVRQNQVSKTSQQQQSIQQNDKSIQKQSDYLVNKYNDPRSRAGNQNKKKNNFYNPVSKTVYVTNIPIQLIKKEQDFLNIFKLYGQVTKHDISKQDKKVTAFVEFDTFQSALNAICFLHNTQHYGKLIQIFFTRSMIK